MSTIINVANCAVEPGPAGAWLVTKTGGTPGAADASAVSLAAINGDFVLRVRTTGGGSAFAGVSAAPLASLDAASIDRALQIVDGVARPYESGVARPGTFTVDGYVWLRRSGGTLEYLNGPDIETAEARRIVFVGTDPLYFDSALLSAGVQLEVKFESPAAAGRRPRLKLTLRLGL
ncbi:MAG: hypothetical protein JOZ90_06770 [Alphaproteobacteria bacterium]|nr:hypothetical protein [Alphaproteobacteria bacterium]MBV9371132.1 hypothetical protein [Alphaproteobacteria bacterium]MBV9900784.1 hypothetical protein [Alphaproteobacteria bacterium]